MRTGLRCHNPGERDEVLTASGGARGVVTVKMEISKGHRTLQGQCWGLGDTRQCLQTFKENPMKPGLCDQPISHDSRALLQAWPAKQGSK